MGSKAGNCFLNETLSSDFAKLISFIGSELLAKKCMHGLAQEVIGSPLTRLIPRYKINCIVGGYCIN